VEWTRVHAWYCTKCGRECKGIFGHPPIAWFSRAVAWNPGRCPTTPARIVSEDRKFSATAQPAQRGEAMLGRALQSQDSGAGSIFQPRQDSCAWLCPRILLGSTERQLSCREASRNEPRITRMGTDRIWDFDLSSVVDLSTTTDRLLILWPSRIGRNNLRLRTLHWDEPEIVGAGRRTVP
jgi:hypothetical protein